ncbi:hypothetical protein [Nocardioides sp.]|uniref:hypothetical protein n=1 Tax=Nocardioides sp. TaxID=35761 RepID=UPI003514940B
MNRSPSRPRLASTGAVPTRPAAIVVALLLALAVVVLPQTRSDAATARSLSLTAPARVAKGGTLALTGRLTRSPKGTRVAIQRRLPSGWRTVTTVATRTASGEYRARIRAASAGTLTLRAVAARERVDGATLAAATSPTRRVTVYVVYAVREIDPTEDGGLNPTDGSSEPTFSAQDPIYSWDTPEHEDVTGNCCSGFRAQFTSVGTEAWFSYTLRGACRSGRLWVRNVNRGTVTFDVQGDGEVLTSRAVGADNTLVLDLADLAGVGSLRIGGVWTSAGGGSSTFAYVRGYLDCDATLR